MYLNQVFQDPHTEPPAQIRVIYEYVDFLILIDINDEKAWPYRLALDEYENLELEQISDPIILVTPDSGSKAEEVRDRAYAVISLLFDDYVDVFAKKERNQRIRFAMEKTGESRLYVTRQLRRYWQRGMSPDALAPDYSKCGVPGQERTGTQKPWTSQHLLDSSRF